MHKAITADGYEIDCRSLVYLLIGEGKFRPRRCAVRSINQFGTVMLSGASFRNVTHARYLYRLHNAACAECRRRNAAAPAGGADREADHGS